MTLRIVHPQQQGSRLTWRDTLFQLVDSVPPEPIEAIPVPDVSELDWPAIDRGEA